MRIRAGSKVRYPDVCVFSGAFDQTVRTLNDANAIFEILSDETPTADRVYKLADYAALPSLRGYVLLDQTAMAATVFRRQHGGPWVAITHTGGLLQLGGLDISLALADLYRGLRFMA